ncbi:hypothetical protein [Bradyrhizobium sp. Leo170]|uniref:hypothetical protein n=1 Tax=Bradyrhizobium sp. Leo170 TaxID=1571199 RepID=UPI0013EEA296|nr:hypothetical protein [Bradyrhizobium sp. Leo170]
MGHQQFEFTALPRTVAENETLVVLAIPGFEGSAGTQYRFLRSARQLRDHEDAPPPACD